MILRKREAEFCVGKQGKVGVAQNVIISVRHTLGRRRFPIQLPGHPRDRALGKWTSRSSPVVITDCRKVHARVGSDHRKGYGLAMPCTKMSANDDATCFAESRPPAFNQR